LPGNAEVNQVNHPIPIAYNFLFIINYLLLKLILSDYESSVEY